MASLAFNGVPGNVQNTDAAPPDRVIGFVSPFELSST